MSSRKAWVIEQAPTPLKNNSHKIKCVNYTGKKGEDVETRPPWEFLDSRTPLAAGSTVSCHCSSHPTP